VSNRVSIKPENYRAICELVRAEAHIQLDGSKEYLVTSRLGKLTPEFGFGTVDELVQSLTSGRQPTLKQRVVEALTTNETLFFRDGHPFEVLKSTILPEAIERRRSCRSLRILSAACSTGQEPYTLAMVLADHFPALESWSIQILATDYNEQVLARAREGKYRQLEVGRGLPAMYLANHFRRAGADWQISESLRRLVEFRRQDIVQPWTGLGSFDIILLRNVLIYFAEDDKATVLSHAEKALADGGALLLGAAENTLGLSVPLVRREVGKTSLYQRRSSPLPAMGAHPVPSHLEQPGAGGST
jgi:chemotaxis protein methyltransferase CheR